MEALQARQVHLACVTPVIRELMVARVQHALPVLSRVSVVHPAVFLAMTTLQALLAPTVVMTASAVLVTLARFLALLQ
jgi:hypothetical protein